MAHHGIKIALRADEQAVQEFENRYQKRHEDFEGYFQSRLVSLTGSESIELLITFTQDFKKSSEEGVLINIAYVAVTQSFWIDYLDCDITKEHSFSTFRLWNSSGDEGLSQPIPAPTAQRKSL